jgi:hypothetical protein
MNRRELHAHIRALFKDMTEEDKNEFIKGTKEAGFKKENYLNISVSRRKELDNFPDKRQERNIHSGSTR